MLQKSFQGAKGGMIPEGTIFVRRSGATERASRLELDMLQDRLLSGSEAEGAAARESQRRSELRGIIGDLVQAGKRWAETMEILVMSSSGNEWKSRDWVEWVDTDSGRDMTQNARILDRNIRTLRLHTDEELLIQPALEVQRRIQGGKAFSAVSSTGDVGRDARIAAYRELNMINRNLTELESAAIELLAGSQK